MEKYIFVRGYGSPRQIAWPGYTLQQTDTGFKVFDHNEDTDSRLQPIENIEPDLQICLLKLDEDMLKNAFNSFAYSNWLKEKMADIDERGDLLYPTLSKTTENLVMYLMELGVSSDRLFCLMYGPGNRFMECKYLVQQFGKMV